MKRIAFLMLLSIALGTLALSTASADEAAVPPTLEQPRPSWYTPDIHAQVVTAGPRGVDVPLRRGGSGSEAKPTDCLGYSPPFVSTSGVSLTAVSAGSCMVSPSGCSMNFIFSDGSSNYIGTAGHCAKRNATVVLQVGTRVDPTGMVEPQATVAAVGKVTKSVNAGIGRDFALVKINPGFRVVPGVAGAAGPTGALCGDPLGQPVTHYGHGYVYAVEQGYPKVGEVIPDMDDLFKFNNSETGYNWAGYGLPGDSGSPVMNDAGLAVGNLTHGIAIDGIPVPGLSFGMTMEGIFNYIGTNLSLVTATGDRIQCTLSLL